MCRDNASDDRVALPPGDVLGAVRSAVYAAIRAGAQPGEVHDAYAGAALKAQCDKARDDAKADIMRTLGVDPSQAGPADSELADRLLDVADDLYRRALLPVAGPVRPRPLGTPDAH
jgi:hypothetical protein